MRRTLKRFKHLLNSKSCVTGGTFLRTRREFICALAGAMAFGAAAMTGCAKSGDNASAAVRPTLTVGSDNYPPYNYLDENGSPTGIDVDIVREACSRIGYDANFTYIVWEDKDALLESGQIDIAAGCFSMTGREDLYSWAGPYATSSQSVAVSPESDIYTLADLKDKVVAVQSTTKPETILLQQTNPSVGEVHSVFCIEDRSLIFPLLGKGYVDAIAAHEESIAQYMKDYGVEYRIIDEPLQTVSLGYAMVKDDPTGIAKKLDETLSQMHADGTLLSIYSKYVSDAEKYLGVDASDC